MLWYILSYHFTRWWVVCQSHAYIESNDESNMTQRRIEHRPHPRKGGSGVGLDRVCLGFVKSLIILESCRVFILNIFEQWIIFLPWWIFHFSNDHLMCDYTCKYKFYNNIMMASAKSFKVHCNIDLLRNCANSNFITIFL